MSLKKFVWIEYSDSKRHTNELAKVTEIKVIEGGNEQFVSRYLFSDRTAHIAGGKMLAPMYFDFDSEDDIRRAQAEAKECVQWFVGVGADPEYIKIRFTGSKGFSVEVPLRYFGVEPHKKGHGARLNLYYRRVAETLSDEMGWKTLDFSVYDARRMWRLTNTRHAKTGLYKIPLDLEELEELSIEEIMDMAQDPRPYKRIYDTEPTMLELGQIISLVNMFQTAVKDVDAECLRNKKRFRKRLEGAADWDEERIFPCVVERIAAGVDLEEGQFRRQPTGFLIAVALKSLGAPDEYIIDRLNEFFDNCNPPLSQKRRDADIPNIIKQINKTDYATHCQTPCFETLCKASRLHRSCWIFSKGEDGLPEVVRRESYSEEEVAKAHEILADEPLKFAHLAMSDIFLEEKLKMGLLLLQLAEENVRVSGESSTGKSHIVDRVMECFPFDWWEKVTGSSDRFLRYIPEFIRTLYIAEFSALRIGREDSEAVAEYDMKIMMSEGVLTTRTVEKEEGKFKTVKKTTKVNNFITTTTEIEAHHELETRQWNLGTDKSISVPFVSWRGGELEKTPWQRKNRDPERRQLRCMMTILDEEAPKIWVVPYMTQILEPLVRLGTPRIRRDIEKLNRFIIAVAKLNYKKRPIIVGPEGERCGVAMPEDFFYAMLYGDEAIFSTLMEMTKREEQVWENVQLLWDSRKEITANTLSAVMSLDSRSANRWLTRWANRGRLTLAETRGRTNVYEIPALAGNEELGMIRIELGQLWKYTKAKCAEYGLDASEVEPGLVEGYIELRGPVVERPVDEVLRELPDRRLSAHEAFGAIKTESELRRRYCRIWWLKDGQTYYWEGYLTDDASDSQTHGGMQG